MSLRCQLTGKRLNRAHKVSHANNKSKRVQLPNLQTKRVFVASTGQWVKLRNGQIAGYKADFSYLEGNRMITEDVKAKNGFLGRDIPLRHALFRHLNPDIELRVVT